MHTKGCLLCVVLLACPAHALADQATVFRCTVDGVVTFSDRPCGDDASVYEGNPVNLASSPVPDPGREISDNGATQSGVAQGKRPRAREDTSIALEQAKRAEACARLDRSLRDIRAKMRAGYAVEQGERLRERQRKLREQSRREKC